MFLDVRDNSIMQLSQPIILTDAAGVVKRMNNTAESLLDISMNSKIINPPSSETACFRQDIRCGNMFITADIIPVSYNSESGFLLFCGKTDLMDLDQLIENIDDAIAIVDRHGTMLKLNKNFTKLTGVDINLMLGRRIEDVVEDRIILESATLKSIRLKKPLTGTTRYKNGKHVTWATNLIFNQNGEIDYVVSTGRDITELIKIEEELQRVESLKEEYYLKLKEVEELLGKSNIIYSSREMQKVLKLSIKAAKSDSSVFIWGESGVGKELFAHLLHRLSDRKGMPFIGINCAAIPSELLEAEIFGYEDGAFTGAKKGGKKGLIEEANGGTIFLDEVGEMPVKMQSKLLRILQEREFMRIGGNKIIPMNVRIIASTNLTKEQLTDDLKFRRDLFYRLSVIPIYVPPLRERRDDIIPIAHYFLDQFNNKYNSNTRISKNLMTRLYNYDWPGNVRELKNVVERLVILSDSGEIDENDFDVVNQFGKNTEDEKSEISITKPMPLKEAISKMEEILIRKAYKEYGSLVKTAEILKIDPCTLHRKIKRLISQLSG